MVVPSVKRLCAELDQVKNLRRSLLETVELRPDASNTDLVK